MPNTYPFVWGNGKIMWAGHQNSVSILDGVGSGSTGQLHVSSRNDLPTTRTNCKLTNKDLTKDYNFHIFPELGFKLTKVYKLHNEFPRSIKTLYCNGTILVRVTEFKLSSPQQHSRWFTDHRAHCRVRISSPVVCFNNLSFYCCYCSVSFLVKPCSSNHFTYLHEHHLFTWTYYTRMCTG